MRTRAFLLLALLALFAAVLLPAQPAAAQGSLTVYDDSLENSWDNWSWCPVDFNATAYVHSGSHSAQITYAAAWQGFYLHHALNTALYDSLTFWINGGASSGQQIQVAGVLNGNGQSPVSLNSFVAGGQVVAGQWRQVTIPLTALHVDNHADFTGFWLQDASGHSQPSFYVDDIVLTGSAPPSTVHLNVNAAQTVRTLDARMFGVNTAVWDSSFNTQATISLLSAMGNGALRFPGGSLSDGYHWQTNTTDNNTWTWVTSFDDFAHVARNVGSQVFITADYGAGTPQEAADWVRYSNVTRSYGFKYWEIGNENYGSWENDLHPRPHDPFTYATLVKDYITRMKAVDSSIKIGVVAVTGEDSYANYTDHPALNPRTGQTHNGWTPVMLATLKSLGVTPDFLIYHRYEQGPGQESDAYLLQAAATWKNDAADLRQQLTDYLGTAGAKVELVCTENNSVYANPGKQTTSLVNGLFLADSFGNLAQTEFNALIWWDLRNSQESGNNNDPALYGWRQYGDYGIVSYANDRYPTYFAGRLLSFFARGGDKMVTAGSDYSLLSIYAAKRKDGTLALLVINKSATYTLNGTIALNGYTPKPNGVVYSYGIPQDDAARTGNGSPDVAQTTLAEAGPTFTYAFPPYSATVLSLSSGKKPGSGSSVPGTNPVTPPHHH